MMKSILSAVLISSSILALSACKTLEGVQQDVDAWNLPAALGSNESSPNGLVYNQNCPQVKVLDELRAYSDFADPVSTAPDNLITSIYVSTIRSACSMDVSSMTVDLNVNFTATLGPQGRTSASDHPFYSYPFFVAVTDPNGKVLTKEIYSAGITFGAGMNTQNHIENMRFILPVETRDHGSRQKIIIGFQLTPEQLEYNRDNMKEYLKTLPPAVLPPVSLTENEAVTIIESPAGSPASYPGQ